MRYKLTIHILSFLFIGLCGFLPTVVAASGDLDTTFNGNGKVTTSIAGAGTIAYAVAIQPDGKIVAAGSTRLNNNTDFALVRYNQYGSLDISFGNNGIVTTDFFGSLGYYDSANAIVIQPDGKIVAAGRTTAGGPNAFALTRYNSDGSLDTTFDGDGKVTTIFGNQGNYNEATAVALQSDGKIVAVGISQINTTDYNFSAARYNSDGSLDTTFDGDGRVTTSAGDSLSRAYGMAIQPDGKIVAVGYSGNSNGANTYNYALVRYNSNGSLDSGFDGDGIATTDFPSHAEDIAYAVAFQTDGKIVVTGKTRITVGNNFSMARYDPNGSLDTTFGSDGKVLTVVGNETADVARAVSIQTNGKIIVAGSTRSNSEQDFALVRYNSDGSLDNSYKNSGINTFDVSGGDLVYGMKLDSIGRAVVVGSATNANFDFAVARVLGDVAPNATVSVSGRLLKTNGNGISNGFIRLTDATGNTRFAITNPFGYFRFVNIPVGTNTFSVSSKRFTFAEITRTINLTENITDLNFTAIE